MNQVHTQRSMCTCTYMYVHVRVLNVSTDQVYGWSIRLLGGREVRRFELGLRRRVDLHTHILPTDKAAYVRWS